MKIQALTLPAMIIHKKSFMPPFHILLLSIYSYNASSLIIITTIYISINAKQYFI